MRSLEFPFESDLGEWVFTKKSKNGITPKPMQQMLLVYDDDGRLNIVHLTQGLFLITEHAKITLCNGKKRPELIQQWNSGSSC